MELFIQHKVQKDLQPETMFSNNDYDISVISANMSRFCVKVDTIALLINITKNLKKSLYQNAE